VPIIKSHVNPTSRSRVGASVQTDGHDETNRRFPRPCERVRDITKYTKALRAPGCGIFLMLKPGGPYNNH